MLLVAVRISLGCQRDACIMSLCVSLSLHVSVSAEKNFRVLFVNLPYLREAVRSGKWASGESLSSPAKLFKPPYHPVLCVDSGEIKLTWTQCSLFQQSLFMASFAEIIFPLVTLIYCGNIWWCQIRTLFLKCVQTLLWDPKIPSQAMHISGKTELFLHHRCPMCHHTRTRSPRCLNLFVWCLQLFPNPQRGICHFPNKEP